MRLVAFAFAVVLLAGCANRPAPARSPEALVPVGATSSDDVPSDPAGSPAVPGANGTAAGPTQWFLHKDRTCEGGTTNLCNCGSERAYMAMDARKGACDGGGSTMGLPMSTDHTEFPADQPMPAYPVGSPVNGTLYLTTDAADLVSAHVELRVAGKAVGGADLPAQLVVGEGGARVVPFPFRFATTQALAPLGDARDVAFLVQVHANQSWFLDADQTSRFTVG